MIRICVGGEHYEVHGSRHAQQPASDHRQADESNCTESVIGDRVEPNGQGDIC